MCAYAAGVTQPNQPEYFELAPAWARSMYSALLRRMDSRFASVQHQLSALTRGEASIMSAVQVEQEVIDSAATALEGLATAVEDFLASNPAIPQAQLDTLNSALADGQKAHEDLSAAAPPATP